MDSSCHVPAPPPIRGARHASTHARTTLDVITADFAAGSSLGFRRLPGYGLLVSPSDQREDPFGWVGATLAGKYLVEAVVGEGGFGIVYRGRHLGFDERVA